MGLEDLETLERIFSQSNQLAAVTRYMSRYHRKVFIDLFFRQWDSDKYANLGTMLFNNYIQALHILETEAAELAHDLEQFNLTESDLEAMWVDQAGHFKELGKERAEEVNGVAYVELLQQLRDIESVILMYLNLLLTGLSLEQPWNDLIQHSAFKSPKILSSYHPIPHTPRGYPKLVKLKLVVAFLERSETMSCGRSSRWRVRWMYGGGGPLWTLSTRRPSSI